jgi:hypothetical protein
VWTTLGGSFDTRFGTQAVVRFDGSTWRMDVYALNNADDSVWVGSFTLTPAGVETWHGWVNLGGVSLSAVAPLGERTFNNAWSGAGRFREAFVEGTDFALWHNWSGDNTNWSGWFSMGKPPNTQVCSAPSWASFGPGRQDVFVLGCDNNLWQIWQDNNGWHGWANLGKPPGIFGLSNWVNTMPYSVASAQNRYEVLVGDRFGRVFDRSWNGSAWSWLNTGLGIHTLPTGMTDGGFFSAYVGNGSNQFTSTVFNFNNWGSVSSSPTLSSPSRAIPIPFDTNVSLVYYRDSSGFIQRIMHDAANNWQTWTNNIATASFVSDPAVVIGPGGQYFVFAVRPDGAIWYTTDTTN